jgi:hypothetical protein
MDPDTGEIRVGGLAIPQSPFDFETYNTYNILLTAADQGKPFTLNP